MRDALLLIDIQNDYFPDGRMELEGSMEAGKKAGELLNFFRTKNLPIIHIQHIAIKPGATFFLPGTHGVDIHVSVKPANGERVITKHFPNSFRETGLEPYLKVCEIDRLVIAGMMTHMCVDATTRAATDLGFTCLIATDACATRDMEWEGERVPAGKVQGAFLAALDGSYGQVMPVDTILKELADNQ